MILIQLPCACSVELLLLSLLHAESYYLLQTLCEAADPVATLTLSAALIADGSDEAVNGN